MPTDTTSRHADVTKLAQFGSDILVSAGLDVTSANQVADSLATADARGISSHGLVRLLPEYVRRLDQGTTNPGAKLRTINQRPSAALINADGAFGQIAGTAAIDLAIEMARGNGVGAVGVANSSHFGIGALFVERASAENMIGLAFTNATPNMPTAGGRSRFLGTNPIAIAVPNGVNDPLVLDMATSVVARGKISMAEKNGQAIPAGWAIDADGHPTIDATAALAGAVLPMAGYKGAGLALMIDILCGVLTGASFGTHVVDLYDTGADRQGLGHFFVAIEIDAFISKDEFASRMEQYVAEIREQPMMPGVTRIYLPGELEFDASRRAERDGVPISPAGWDILGDLARQWKIAPLVDRRSAEYPVQRSAN